MKYLLFFLFMASAQAGEKLENLKPLLNPKAEMGDKALVYFWASWCPDCREKLSGVVPNLKKEFPKVSVITVNGDREEAKGKKFAEDEKLDLPVYRDENKDLTKSLKLFAVPAWAVLQKKNGEWLAVKSGTGFELSEVKKILEAL